MKKANNKANILFSELAISPDDITNKGSCETILNLLICQVCFHIIVSPVQCEKCDQCFCEYCIKRNKNNCPYKCSSTNFKKNRFVNNILSTLKFKCSNGCGKIIDYDNLGKHYDEECEKIDFKKKYLDLKKRLEKAKKKKEEL